MPSDTSQPVRVRFIGSCGRQVPHVYLAAATHGAATPARS